MSAENYANLALEEHRRERKKNKLEMKYTSNKKFIKVYEHKMGTTFRWNTVKQINYLTFRKCSEDENCQIRSLYIELISHLTGWH